jgi:hypothetical protein
MGNDTQREESQIRFHSAAFALKRSGRIIRSVSTGKHRRNTLIFGFPKLNEIRFYHVLNFELDH